MAYGSNSEAESGLPEAVQPSLAANCSRGIFGAVIGNIDVLCWFNDFSWLLITTGYGEPLVKALRKSILADNLLE